jgi:hypothetical protein
VAAAPSTARTVETIRTNLSRDLALEQREAGKLIDDARRRVEKIQRDLLSWATKSANSVIPDDIGRTKQNELTQQLVRANHEVTKLEQASEDFTEVVSAALDLIRDCGEAYTEAVPLLRRDWNQTFFTAIEVDVDKVTDSTLKPPFDTMLDPRTIARYNRAAPVARSRAQRRTPIGALPDNDSSDAVLVGVGLSNDSLVEVTGLEPATSTLRTVRSLAADAPWYEQTRSNQRAGDVIAPG